ncbi:MAG: nickel-dependent lactate racemase [Clostridiales bacterium]|nr:nickel-dependent lactate racemase [Clostridiales bacterium]
MKIIEIPYGKNKQFLHVEEAPLKAVLTPQHTALSQAAEEEIVKAALENPIASPRLADLAKGKKNILLITSDHTRPVPSRVTMPPFLAEIRKGSPEANITILIATGMHRPTTEAELRAKMGDEIVDHETIVVHEALKQEDMAYFGILPSGGELWLNKLVKESDLVVAEGFIEPHFFAGFSGGRKSILPGVASGKTVLYNHNSVFLKSPHARQGSLKENPIHKDMLFAAQQAKLCFILNVLIDSEKKVIAAVAGDLEKAHEEGCALSRKLTQVPAVEADIAITSNGGYPLDQNVYQAVKGMTAAEACVKQGGAVIMCAALGDGAGGDEFYHWFADRENPQAVARDIEKIPPEETRMDQWEAQMLARVLCKASCYFVTEPENKEMIENMHMHWAPDVDTALAMARKQLGENATVTVIPDGVGVIVTPEA